MTTDATAPRDAAIEAFERAKVRVIEALNRSIDIDRRWHEKPDDVMDDWAKGTQDVIAQEIVLQKIARDAVINATFTIAASQPVRGGIGEITMEQWFTFDDRDYTDFGDAAFDVLDKYFHTLPIETCTAAVEELRRLVAAFAARGATGSAGEE